MDRHGTRILYAHKISLSLPESVVSFGIALAISAMAFPSCCIGLTLADIIKVLVLVATIARRTITERKSGCIMIPISAREVK